MTGENDVTTRNALASPPVLRIIGVCGPRGALFRNQLFRNDPTMARWPRHFWTTLFTYGIIFIGFPVLCWWAYRWVRGE